jgi:hypothetical protein
MQQRHPLVPVLLSLLIFVAVSISELVAADPVDAIPRSASFVIRVKNPQAALKKLDGYLSSFKAMQFPSLHKTINEFPEGVDISQGLWIVGFTTPRAIPSFAALVFTSDKDKALQSLKEGIAGNRRRRKYGRFVERQASVCRRSEVPEGRWPGVMANHRRRVKAIVR